ncbi:hypothetical protein CP556_23925 [Natrinema sp. CBA1119]|nr:hypothetical protein CP556_23925 [Natrinema sp. CBA1119]
MCSTNGIERDRSQEWLLEHLSRLDLEARGESTLLQHNDPWTPPFMRTNEVEVELEVVPERLRREAP